MDRPVEGFGELAPTTSVIFRNHDTQIIPILRLLARQEDVRPSGVSNQPAIVAAVLRDAGNRPVVEQLVDPGGSGEQDGGRVARCDRDTMNMGGFRKRYSVQASPGLRRGHRNDGSKTSNYGGAEP